MSPPSTNPQDRARRTTAQLLDRLLHPREQREIVDAIRAAEAHTSGEIKVHVEARCRAADPYSRAVELFDALGLHRTERRNGVLVYVAVHDRRFSLVGDIGIGEAATSPFWVEAAGQMSIAFRRGAFGEGIVAGVRIIGDRLARRFPARPGDRHEIDNEISAADTLA